MSLHCRAPLPLRILGALAAYAFAGVVTLGARRWNEPIGAAPASRPWLLAVALAAALLLVGCSAARPWTAFELPGIIAGGEATTDSARLYVLVGMRVVPVPVDRSVFDRFRRGDRVTVTGEARGQRLRRVAVLVPAGMAA